MSKTSSSNTLDSTHCSFYKSLLNEIYANLTSRSGSNEYSLTYDSMEEFLCLPHFVSRNICRALDAKSKGCISQHDFVEGIHTLYRGDIELQQSFLFNMLDLDEDGWVEKEDLAMFQTQLGLRSLSSQSLFGSMPARFNFSDFVKNESMSNEMLKCINVHENDLLECLELYRRVHAEPIHDELKDNLIYFSRTSSKIKPYFLKQIGRFLFQFKCDDEVTLLKSVYVLVSTFLKQKNSILIEGKIFDRVTLISKINNYHEELTLYFDKSHFIDSLYMQIKNKKFEEYFKIHNEVGESQIGKLYDATSIKTGEKVRVKVLNKSKSNHNYIKYESDMFDFLKSHSINRNIILPIEKFEEPDTIYFVYEHFEEDLNSFLMKRKKLLGPLELMEVVKQISEALKFLHANGIVHRDLTTDNLVVTYIDAVPIIKIFGFNYAKLLGKCERLTNFYGPLWYCAPEVLKKMPFNFGADVWSLGISIYYLRFGRFPFDPDNFDVDSVINLDVENVKGIFYEPNEEIDFIIENYLTENPNRSLI